MIIYAIATQKGGTGKTTTAAALAQAATYKGKRVLAVDLDPQANLTYCLGADAKQPGSFYLLHGTPAAEVIQHTAQGIDVIAASDDLQTEKSAAGSARRLKAALDPVSDQYDLCMIDTPATAGELQYNALQAAHGLIVPMLTDGYNLQSLNQLAFTFSQFQETNPALHIAGLMVTQYDKRPLINRQIKELIENTAGDLGLPFLGAVRRGIAMREAAALQESIFKYAPKSNPAQDYMDIYEKLEAQEV